LTCDSAQTADAHCSPKERPGWLYAIIGLGGLTVRLPDPNMRTDMNELTGVGGGESCDGQREAQMFAAQRRVPDDTQRAGLRWRRRVSGRHTHVLGSHGTYKKTSGIGRGSNPGSAPRLEEPHFNRLMPATGALSTQIPLARRTIAHCSQGVNERLAFGSGSLLFITICQKESYVRDCE
jgi:hypothetical protein